jgi:hypothetical protein
MARQVAPPRPAPPKQDPPKPSDNVDYRRLAAPGELLKNKLPSGKNGLVSPPTERSSAPALPEGEIDGITSSVGKELLTAIAEFQGSANALCDWWRGNRSRRNALTPDDQAIAKKAYDAKFTELFRG